MNKEKIKDLCLRILKIFITTFVSSVIVQLASMNFIEYKEFKNVLVGIVISAGVAGISAVWNTVLLPFLLAD